MAKNPTAAGGTRERPAASRPPARSDTVPSRRGRSRRGRAEEALQLLGRGFHALGRNADKSVFPISLIFLVIAFVAVQNRIDRGDPKLALAPVDREPDMEFGPPIVP